jgi:Calcineurin-like phosphoesterase superfamily domain
VPDTLDEWDARNAPAPEATVRAVADLLHRAGVAPEEVAAVEAVRLSEYQQAYKDSEGEAHVLDLKATSVVLTPVWETGPRWPVVQPAPAAKVTFAGRAAKAPPATDGLERVLVLPDPQVGYRLNHALEPEAFHDEAAMRAAVALARVVRPDRIVCLGDTLDLPAFSAKFRQEPSFAITTQAAIDYTHNWLAALARIAPVDLLEGNHDARLGKFVADNALAAFGLRRANTPEQWPVLTVPSLLRVGEDELEDVTYHPGYPVGIVWLAPNLACVHGTRLKLSQVLDDERVCVVQGHTHKAALTYRQRRTYHGPALMWAASPGCLCRTDGAVPGSNAAVSDHTGHSIERPQDWHQGCAVVTYDPTGERLPVYEFAPITDGTCRWRDHVVTGGDP